MYPTIYPDGLTQVYSTLQDLHRSGLSPGVFRSLHNGGRVYQLVKNNHASALTVGDPICIDMLAADTDSEVKQFVTATFGQPLGVAMGDIPASGFGWVCRYGYVAAVRVKGDGTAIVAGDSLKPVTATFTLIHDTDVGVEAAFAAHVRALDGATAADTTIEGFVRGW
jgi:hypothetical protein